MGKIRIVTDSTADIPLAVREELGIIMVPLKVHFANDTFLDSLTIQSDEFYEKLVQSPVLPTTSQPSPVDFLEIYKTLLVEPGVEIISIHLSAAMSGTYQSAVLAKSLLDQPEQLTIVDSKSASYGIGMLAVRAARAAQEGKTVEEILELVESIRQQTKLYFAVGTLEFLQKGGRIGKASALFGALLNIKPILTIDAEGEVAPIDKVRGQKKAMNRIVELIKQDYEGKPLDIMVAHGKAPELADELGGMVKEHFDVKRYGITSVGPVIGTHVGPGVTAVFVCPAE
jgi:DegV family protein with EDD domain